MLLLVLRGTGLGMGEGTIPWGGGARNVQRAPINVHTNIHILNDIYVDKCHV